MSEASVDSYSEFQYCFWHKSWTVLFIIHASWISTIIFWLNEQLRVKEMNCKWQRRTNKKLFRHGKVQFRHSFDKRMFRHKKWMQYNTFSLHVIIKRRISTTARNEIGTYLLKIPNTFIIQCEHWPITILYISCSRIH